MRLREPGPVRYLEGVPAEYHHAIFLSYPDRGTIPRWARDFAVVLREELENHALTPAMFVDREGIRTGNDWPLALREAHLRAMAFVPILCSPYFKSGWCTSEWANAMARAATVGRRLVFPVWFNDGTQEDLDTLTPAALRDEVLRCQAADFRDLSYDFDPAGRTPETRELRKRVRRLCDDLRPVLVDPPPWDPGWPVLPLHAVRGADPTWNPRLGGEAR